MVKMTTLRFMLGVVATDNLELIHLVVKMTFLHGVALFRACVDNEAGPRGPWTEK